MNEGGPSARIVCDSAVLAGDLTLVDNAMGIILFAHGSGSSRHSPRNRHVAAVMQNSGFSTLLMDLLTEDEEAEDASTGDYRFDVDLLADRLVGAMDWLLLQPDTRGLPIGLFGASTGAAAALIAAARQPGEVAAVVSRGGRPDLAGEALREVRAPTLLIVGGEDAPVIQMNREALGFLPGRKRLDLIPGATHLFEEPGRLDDVARLATEWFAEFLAGDRV
jgi:pimeloyl-ACP methyl ester carboxylesterase